MKIMGFGESEGGETLYFSRWFAGTRSSLKFRVVSRTHHAPGADVRAIAKTLSCQRRITWRVE